MAGHRVVLAGGRNLLRHGMRSLLEACAQIEIVASCHDRLATLAAIDRHAPDVVVAHVFLEVPGGGATLAADLRREHPTLGVVLLLGEGQPGEAVDVLAQGTQRRALLLLDHPRVHDDLVAAITEVADGGSIIHPGVVDLLVRGAPASSDPFPTLTPRERQVFHELAHGASNARIASSLGLSERAVEKHINQLYAKLGLRPEPETHRRVAAALRYLVGLADAGGTAPPR